MKILKTRQPLLIFSSLPITRYPFFLLKSNERYWNTRRGNEFISLPELYVARTEWRKIINPPFFSLSSLRIEYLVDNKNYGLCRKVASSCLWALFFSRYRSIRTSRHVLSFCFTPHREIPLVPTRSTARSNRSLLGRTYITSIEQFDKNSFGGCPLFADPIREMLAKRGDPSRSMNCLNNNWKSHFKVAPKRRNGHSVSRIENSFCQVIVLVLLSEYSHDCNSPSLNFSNNAVIQ